MSFFYICDDADAGLSCASDVAVLIVSGELDYTASPHLKERILDRLRAGRQRLVIDLSAVTFIDSMAIGLLIGTATQLRETGGSLRVVCAEENERVLRIFDIAGVAGSIPLDRSRADALGLLAAPSARLPAWAEQTTAIATPAGRRPPARQAGLAAAHRYAVEAAAVADDHHAVSHRQRGGEIDSLA